MNVISLLLYALVVDCTPPLSHVAWGRLRPNLEVVAIFD